ncbi:MAG: cupin 2 conserved barrel protein [uncultured bacterium]|nr:MAG: cupin 2 conserved barrel protein [uncultured bacterium]
MKNLAQKSVMLLMLTLGYGQAQADPVKIEQILQTTQSWNGASLPGFASGKTEFRVLKFKISPGAKTSIHMHPLNGAGYVLSGELTMYSTDDSHGSFADEKHVKKITLTAGNAWTETVNTWHYGENKGKEDVEFVLIFAGQDGTPPTLSLGTFVK